MKKVALIVILLLLIASAVSMNLAFVGVSTPLKTVAAADPPEMSILNPGPTSKPAQWTAGPADGVGTDTFNFSTSTTTVGQTFFINVTVTNVTAFYGWGLGITFDNSTLQFMSASRPTDHVFAGAEDLGFTLIAPSAVIDPVGPSRLIVKWGCTYINDEANPWSFNGSGVCAQLRFNLTAQGSSTLEFDPTWTAFYYWPSGTEVPTLNDGLVLFGGGVPPTPFFLTITALAGGTTNPAPGTYQYDNGTSANVTAAPNSGFTFSGWKLDSVSAGTANPIAVLMTANHTLEADFQQIVGPNFSLIVTISGNGTTNPTPGTYVYGNGTSVDVTAAPNSGFTFSGWKLDSVSAGTANPITVLMTANHTLQAVFEPVVGGNFSLVITVSGNGTTNPTPGTYTYPNGTIVTVTAIPLQGITFGEWKLDGISAGSSLSIDVTMNQNHTLQAVFIPGVVIPEFWLGPVLGITGMFAAFAAYYIPKKRKL